uniref:Peptidase M12B domain-containing protein n=1 Tax=Syphacia muris TaxID=451379 RepID=A0A0N5B015_9BILA
MDQVQAPQYYASYQTGTYAYAKVAMFADYALVFQPLNIHVSLVYAEVWSHGDPFNIPNSSATANYDLQKFARRFMKLVQCDHVSVLSGVRFEDVETIGGRAQMEQICKESGTSIVTGKLTLVDVAGTVFAHELGHSIGLRHDEDYPGCSCPYRTGCIMGAKTSTGVGKMYFSTCSVAHLQQILMSTARYNCMSRPPTAVDTAARCGNGVLEAGEQCDCGISVTCRVGCCDYSTCQAKAGVQCADGECCDLKTCSLRSPGAVCRGAKDICDLPEFCDGQNNRCPADYYMKNGTPCARFTRNYCFEGKCGDREKACKETWGEQAVRTDQCLSLNLHGSQGANCGFFPKVKYCNKHSYVCGRLYCSPNIKNFVAPPGMVSLVIQGQNCVGTVPANKFVTEDKGLVPSGASCGKDAVI